MRKLIAGLIIGSVAAVGVASAYLWYTTKTETDRIFALAPMLGGEANYGSVTVSPFGVVSVNDIRFTPADSSVYFTAESLSITAPSVFDLMNLKEKFMRGETPDELQVAISGLKVPLYGDFINSVNDAIGDLQQPTLEAHACGDLNALGPAQWRKMGIEDPLVDLSFGYHADTTLKRLVFDGKLSARALSDASWRFELPFSSLNELIQGGFLTAGGKKEASVVKVAVELMDHSYNERRNAYCAELSDLDVDEYLDKHIAALAQEFRYQGVEFTSESIAAYRTYVSGKAHLTLELWPSDAMTFDRLSKLDSYSLLRDTGLQVTLNQAPVELEFASIDPPTRPVRQVAAPERPEATDKPVGEVLRRQLTFRPTSINEASANIGKRSIVMANGRRFDGLLTNVRPDALALRVRMTGGNVTYWFRLGEISEFRVATYSLN